MLAVLFLLQGGCFLSHPGISAAELNGGPLKTALFWVEFHVSQPGPEALRIPMVWAGAFTIVLACLLLWRMAGGTAAITGALLLATDSTFVVSTRLDAADAVLPRLLLVAGCLLVLRFWQEMSRVSLAAGCFCLAAACAERPEMGWVAIAVVLAGAVVFSREIKSSWAWRTAWPAGCGLAIGCGLFWAGARNAVAAVSPSGWFRVLDGSAWFGYVLREDFGVRGLGPRGVLEGTSVQFARAFGYPRHDLLAGAVVFAVIFGLAAFVVRDTAHRRALRFALIALVAGAAALLASHQGSHGGSDVDYLLLWPWPQILIAVALASAARRWTFGPVVLAAVAGVMVIASLAVTANFYARSLLFGGTRPWTEAIYPLAADFSVRDAREVRVLSPGIAGPLLFLSRGRVRVSGTADGEDTLFIAGTDVESQEVVERFAAASHRIRRPVRIIQDDQGRSLFRLFRLE